MTFANPFLILTVDLTLRKIAIWMSKNYKKFTFFQKNWQKLSFFFQQNCQWQFCWKKKTIFVNFFEKNVKFLAIFWQSNGNFPEGQVKTEFHKEAPGYLCLHQHSWCPPDHWYWGWGCLELCLVLAVATGLPPADSAPRLLVLHAFCLLPCQCGL